MLTFERMLLCVDGSAPSLQAARVAARLAANQDCLVRVVAVVGDGDVTGPIDLAVSGQAPAAERLGRGGQAVLDHVVRLLDDHGVTSEAALERGAAAEVILAEARRWRPDVIVLGRSGRHGPGSAFLGSVTEHVLEFAEVPVLVVPEARGR